MQLVYEAFQNFLSLLELGLSFRKFSTFFFFSSQNDIHMQTNMNRKSGLSKVDPELFVRDELIFMELSLPQVCLYRKCVSKF